MNPPDDAVVVSGLGLHGPFGESTQTQTSLQSGRRAISMQCPVGSRGFPQCPGALALPASPAEYLSDRKLQKYMSQTTAMAVIAAGRALRDAGLYNQATWLETTGLYTAVGLTVFDLTSVSNAVEKSRGDNGQLDLIRMGREGLAACHPLMPFQSLLNMPVGLISIVFGIKGENFVAYPDSSQSGACIETAVRGIRAGRLDRAMVGGSSQGFSLMTLGRLWRKNLLAHTPDAAVPYRETHRGMAPGDAAGFLVLERAADARQRNAWIYATLDGISAGRNFDLTSEARMKARERHWQRAAAGRTVDLVLSCGNGHFEDDAHELNLATRLNPQTPPSVGSLDAVLGELGPAGLFVSAAVLLHAQRQAAWPLRLDGALVKRAPQRVLISSGDADGAHAALVLSLIEAKS